MKNFVKPCACLFLVALAAFPAWADFIPDSRLSWMRATALDGNGPVASTYDQTVTETGLLVSGPVVHNHFNFFDDDFWGRSETETTMTQTILFTGGGPEGVRVDGSIDPNAVLVRMIRGSGHGAPSLAQGSTDSAFDFVFTVTAPSKWQIDMSATRNPTGDFAVSLYNLSAPGYVYFSPLGPPFTDSASGILAPGQYKFHARQDTFAQTTPADATDSATATFRLQVHTLADMNCDGQIDFFDVDPFILALTDPDAYIALYPNCNIANGDVNNDEVVDFFDIDPFVDCVINGGC